MANVRLPSLPLWLMVFYTKPNPGTIYSHLPQSQNEPLITVIFNNLCYWANPNLSPSTASRSFKGISGIFSLSRCPNKAFVFTWQIEKSTFYNCPCPKQRLVLSASTPVGIRSAFAVGVRHQWHQSWAGHSLRSNTAPSWKLRSHRKEHPGQSPPPQLQVLARWEAWGAGLWALPFISKKDKQHQILPEGCSHNTQPPFQLLLLILFSQLFKKPPVSCMLGLLLPLEVAPSATSVRNS